MRALDRRQWGREPAAEEHCSSYRRLLIEGRPLDDVTLIDEARRGDARAYGDLVLGYQDLAFRTAFLMLRDAAEAEDVIQEAFVKAYCALSHFRPGSPFRPWLLKIVANEARNRQVAVGRRSRLEERLGASRLRAGAEASSEEVALEGESRNILLQTVNGLPPMDRLVIACRFFLDLSEIETAAVLHCPRGTVKSRLSRALGRLREALSVTDRDIRSVDAGAAHE